MPPSSRRHEAIGDNDAIADEYVDTDTFRGAHFTGADFTEATFRYCDLRHLKIP